MFFFNFLGRDFIERTVLFIQAVLIFIAQEKKMMKLEKINEKCFHFKKFFFFFNTELKIDKTSKIKKSYNRKIMKNIDNIILNHKTKE